MKGNIAYLKGALADGHVYDLKKRIRIVVRQKDKRWLEDTIAPILTDLTSKEPKIIQTSDGVYMIYVYVHKINVEQEILNLLFTPLGQIKFDETANEIEFVKGFFDAEGSLYQGRKKSDKRAIMYQKEKEVLEYVKDILNKLNITSKIYGPYKNGKNTIYRLIVFTEKNTNSFLKEIAPLNKSKSE